MQSQNKSLNFPNATFGNGPSIQEGHPPITNGKHSTDQDAAHSQKKSAPPHGTFDKTSFNQLLRQYDLKHDLPPTIELAQAFAMTYNMKEAAGKVNGLTQGGSNYLFKNDYVGDLTRMSDSMQSVSRLVGNLGTSDKASNFLLEQKNLLRAQANENREIRNLIEAKVVDGLQYVRMKEQIAETKSRVKDLIDERFSSEDESESKEENEVLKKSEVQASSQQKNESSETQEDSEEAQKLKEVTTHRIKALIKQLRKDGQQYLNIRDNRCNEKVSIHKIWNKLRKNERYLRKRESKALGKNLIDQIQLATEQLNDELNKVKKETTLLKSSRKEILRQVQLYEQAHGLEKRIKNEKFDKSISELDGISMNQKSFDIQNVLFNYCGVNLKGKNRFNHPRKSSDIFGRIKKLPQKSTLLASYQDQGENKGSFTQNENSLTNIARKKNIELVKVIGIEPEKLFQTLDKYRIRTDKMPKFSNVFERAEPIIPGLGMTVAGSLMTGSQTGQMSYARVDGRNVISLQFNPYELDDPSKKKVYETAVKEVVEQREKIKSISKGAKEKQEQSNIKRAWQNIVKKDIPKAFRGYQKYKLDQENNCKKQSQACQKEVRKKVLRTQRLQRETPMRAKKLTKEMMNFWKRRDKELADMKKKKDKYEKEIKRKQEEERENILQKKRLEYLMSQSEIYSHFMSKKLGLHEEQQKQRQQDLEEEQKERFSRVDIDDHTARNSVAQMINDNRQRVVIFDQEVSNKRADKFQSIQEDELQIDALDQIDTSGSKIIEPPKSFKGKLKDYQLKGLRWLDNLYEQGINGILADEMGLGKTIQAIALLSHIVETKGVSGPFLVIVPVTTLHNWQNELSKFCPSLKVLPYFGNPEERKKLGRFLDPKNLYNPSMQINVLLTSYNLIANTSKDQQKLIRVKWHYMILDEAQAIKNNLSRRWKILLQFNTRNRLLLTGTPIQNTMAELWALLHFIMPKLFDNHEQFQEWFSKDIELHSQNQGEINKHQLKRLHLVLKPFMLRRLKKDVEQEIGPKTEFQEYCEMTHRQRVLYQRIKNKISTKDLFQLVDSKQKMENLMNLVMQFRKVCNHPELFERRIGRIPFSFRSLQQGMQLNPNFSSQPDVRTSMKNPICYEVPKMVYDECYQSTDNMARLFRKVRKNMDEAFQEISLENHMRFFNIFNNQYIHERTINSKNSGGFGILRLLQKSNNWSVSDLSYLFVADPLIKQVALMHYYHQKYQKRIYHNIHNNNANSVNLNYNSYGPSTKRNIDLIVMDFAKRDECQILFRENKVSITPQISQTKNSKETNLQILEPLIPSDLNSFTKYSLRLKEDLDIYVNKCLAETIQVSCLSGNFNRFISSVNNGAMQKKILVGKTFKPKIELSQGRIGRDRSAFLTEDSTISWKNGPPTGYQLFEKGIIGDLLHEKGSCLLELPNYGRLVSDCAKMKFLDKLLTRLSQQKHRCLIFCQMTRMLDILEDFLSWRKYTYFRMDGSTSIPDRRYMVEEYQKNPDIFAFLLSTRAGGLGVNLTGADTVIFYDNDWNPTMDAQATDRAHRIGQTKAVSVFRIITKNSVEEKILKRAKQKQNVQSTVYGGNSLKAETFKPKEIVDLLLDEEEQNDLKQRSQKFLKTKRIKKRFMTSDSHQVNQEEDEDMHMDNFDSPQKVVFKKESASKAEPKISEKKAEVKKEEHKKPGRKLAEQKVVEVKQPKQAPAQNIFATVRKDISEPPQKSVSGPFSVFTISKQNNNNNNQSGQSKVTFAKEDEIMANDDDSVREIDEDEIGEDQVQKFLDIFEQQDENSDEDEGDQFEYNDDDGNNNLENLEDDLNQKASNGREEDDQQDDEDMNDEY